VLKDEEAALVLDGLIRQTASSHLFTPAVPLPSSTALDFLNQAAAAVQDEEPDNASDSANEGFQQRLPEIEDPRGMRGAPATPDPAAWWMVLAGVVLIGMGCGSTRWG
jgi:hypothetical protein